LPVPPVIRVLAVWKIQTPLVLFCPSSTSVPVIWKVPDAEL